MKKQRQIYFFLPNFAIGGAGNSIFNICKVIKRADRSINVISIGKNYYSNKFRNIGVKVLELNNPHITVTHSSFQNDSQYAENHSDYRKELLSQIPKENYIDKSQIFKCSA